MTDLRYTEAKYTEAEGGKLKECDKLYIQQS